MIQTTLQDVIDKLCRGEVVPYLGPGVLADVVNTENGEAMPADNNSLILAMNNGRPLSARLMFEFSRAAMHIELRRGRPALERFLDQTYGQPNWTRAALHDWLVRFKPPYIIDINRDSQLQDGYADTPHTLIRGIARIGGNPYRFRLHHYDGHAYHEIEQSEVEPGLPVLFKPMGSPRPDATYIASDADYVDYITELMGGLAIPDFLKTYRQGRRYLFIGLRMTRDTERMVLADVIYAAGDPAAWALIAEPNDKERRFCQRKNIEIIQADVSDLLAAAGFGLTEGPGEKNNSHRSCSGFHHAPSGLHAFTHG